MRTDTLGRYTWLFLLIVSCVMFLPWLGETLFNTKGEPREAIVAVAMLKTGNWILPVSFGTDIPYKPPFLAWCISACSLITGGVDEYSSRLPSAIATIAIVMTIYGWMRRNGISRLAAFSTGIVFISSIEVWRAASACRVDMVLTACMVGAMVSMFNFIERRRRYLPWLAILLMTCAVLTKGPVGMLLPCLCGGVYGLLRGRRFWGLFFRFLVAGLLSCILPALWYIAAYSQGGETFLDLAMEENFGRFTGTMSYASHENPFWYNFQTVFLGMLPYTILALMALSAVKWKGSGQRLTPVTEKLCSAWKKFLTLDPITMFSITVTVLIFVFYCIPKSKRSVYLLPIYPFLAYFIVMLAGWIKSRKPRLVEWFARIVAGLAVIVPSLYILIKLVNLPESLIYRLGHNAALITGIAESASPFWIYPVLAIPFIGGIVVFRNRIEPRRIFMATSLTVSAILLSLSAVILPPMLSAKSDKYIAEEIQRIQPQGNVYMFIDDPMLRFYTVNFYLGDRILLLGSDSTREGILLTGEFDLPALHEKYDEDYRFEALKSWGLRSCDTRRPVVMLRFSRK